MSQNQESKPNQQTQYDPLTDGMDMGLAAKAKDPKKTIKKFMVYLAPHKTAVIAALTLAMFSTIFFRHRAKAFGTGDDRPC